MRSMLGGSLEQAAVGLDDLVAASVAFVRRSPTGGVRDHAFAPVRGYALELLGAADWAGLRQQHLETLLLWVRALGRQPALDAFRDELPNLGRFQRQMQTQSGASRAPCSDVFRVPWRRIKSV